MASKEDDVSKISTSIFVTNFLESFTAEDLFHSYKVYGHVVDSFIPLKRSREGKRFGFVRFINVFNAERLVSNLYTVWVGRIKLHANIARFNRAHANRNPKSGKPGHVKKDGENNKNGAFTPRRGVGSMEKGKSFVDVLSGKNRSESMESESSTAIVLDDDCLYYKDLSKSLLGRVKEVTSLSNLKKALINEGFDDLTIRYMGEFWILLEFESVKSKDLFRDNTEAVSWFSVMRQASNDFIPEGRIVWVEVEGILFKVWSRNTFNRIAAKWGELLDFDDQEDLYFHSKRLCICTKLRSNIFENFKIVYRGKVCWIRAKEVLGWIPEFLDDSDDENQSEEGINDHEPVGHDEHSCGDDNDVNEVAETLFDDSSGQKKNHSEDPFGFYPLLNKNKDDMHVNGTEDEQSIKYPLGFTPKAKNREFNLSEENVRSTNVENLQPENDENSKDLRHRKQEDSHDKCMLWDYLTHVSSQWDGEVVMMGDFNEVRFKSDKFGSIFNVHGAGVFNSFIANAGLVEVPLGGSAFTWSHKLATKMRKIDRFLISDGLMNTCPNINAITLERYLSNHYPILFSESTYDYGPIPFRFYHHWLALDGFDNFVIDSWRNTPGDKSNAMRNLMYKLKFLKVRIRGWLSTNRNIIKAEITRLIGELAKLDEVIDNGNATDDTVPRRLKVLNSIQNLNQIQATEEAQKAKNKASGLKMNMSKSKILGIHVEALKVKQAASKLECLILKTPFSYLGKKVGGSMSRVHAWDEVVEKVTSRLSRWKMKTLSIGGRLTLIKSVLGSIPMFYISIFKVPSSVLQRLESIRSHFFKGHDLGSNKASWVKWSSVLTPKEKGGLEVSSLYALNRGLLFKWVWKFYAQKSSLWARVIKAIHGVDEKMGKLNMGNGESTTFWEDRWLEGSVLKDIFPRLYVLKNNKKVSVGDKLKDFRYVWSLSNSGDFSVASFRKVIGENRYPGGRSRTRWVKYVPIKVNVTAWKIKMDALPTRLNISRSGMDIQSLSCHICDCGVESSRHLFFQCNLVRQVIRKISSWWNINYVDVNSYEEWLIWLISLRLTDAYTYPPLPRVLLSYQASACSLSTWHFLKLKLLENSVEVLKILKSKLESMKILKNKLESFLISDGLMNTCPNINAITLERYLSDHYPILFCESTYDYGPIHFRFYHHWLALDGFDNFVIDSWRNTPGDKSNAMRNLMYKLKFLKVRIRGWLSTNRNIIKAEITRLIGELAKLDEVIDNGNAMDDTVPRRLEYFQDRFDEPKDDRVRIDMCFLRSLSNEQMDDLERMMSMEEVKRAVWDCGTDKSPGPDGFLFGDIVNEMQSAFIAERQILDGRFILNEVMHCCKTKKKQALFFKVDFEKAYDTVQWDFLDDVLHKASDLKMNMNKSKILGIHVEAVKVKQAASKLRCLILKTPFSYLGHDLESNKASWVKWSNVLTPNEKGGLKVSSLYALNRGLLFKWVSKFYAQKSFLWARVIKAIHGVDEKMGKAINSGASSCWTSIVREVEVLKQQGNDRYVWSLSNSGDFSVASFRKVIDENRYPGGRSRTRWVKYVPIKVNVTAWKIKMDDLPTRLNISRSDAYTYPPLPRVPLSYQASACSLSTWHFLKLKLLENSVEVLKILKNKLESMKILNNKLESTTVAETELGERAETKAIDSVAEADVERGHGGDGGGDDRPPTHHIPIGCGGFVNRGKGTRKPNLDRRKAGRLHTRQETQNLRLIKTTDDKGPVPIRFEWDDKKTMMPLERKVAILTKIGTQFDLKPHMQSQRWTDINAGIRQHLQKLYNTSKASLKAAQWVINLKTGTLPFGMIPGTKPKPLGKEHGRMPVGVPVTYSPSRSDDGELIYSRVPVVDPHLLRDTHCWQASRLQHRVGCALHRRRDYGHRSKGKAVEAPSRCWVLLGRATGGCPPPPQSIVDPADVEKLKKRNKRLTKQ
nr:RNA-directed DNA polymerase, eukaryota, reverse transcriptase zinc-binding domain protein [Tanacetum cinerariifolium]